MPSADWRDSDFPLRARLPDSRVELIDASGLDLSQSPAAEMGDPIVRRTDGVIAYHLVVVVDDAASRVSHIVQLKPNLSSSISLWKSIFDQQILSDDIAN